MLNFLKYKVFIEIDGKGYQHFHWSFSDAWSEALEIYDFSKRKGMLKPQKNCRACILAPFRKTWWYYGPEVLAEQEARNYL